MTGSALATAIPELDQVAMSGTLARREQILQQLTNLIVSQADCLSEAQIGLFDDVLIRLFGLVKTQSLVRLAETLSGLEMAPREAVRRLAFHDDASVAASVLAKSNRLSENDLIEIASTLGQQHLLAISGRASLSEALTDALIRRGDADVHTALAQNEGARFSGSGYAKLVGEAGRDETLTETLGLRVDIPAKLLRDILIMATDVVRARFLTAARPVRQEKSQTPGAAKEGHAVPSNPADYAKAQGELIALNRAGKLNEAVVNRFAVKGDYVNVVAALSFMADVEIEAILPLIHSGHLYGLIVACKAARLNWGTTTMIIRNRPECAPPTQQEMEQSQAVFETLLLSVAQWTIRFGADRIAATQKQS